MSEQTRPRAGSVALVTGAGSGIGAATARALARAGCRVVCTGRRLAPIERLAAEIGEAAVAVALDVTDPSSVDSLLARIPEPFREVEILVNNAGHDVGGRRPFHAGSAEQWASIVETNVTGLIRVTRALIEPMIARDRGHVVNLGSTSGVKPYATGSIYSATKHAVHGFSEALRLDYRGTGIRVTEILPGMVRTDFAATRLDDAQAADAFYDGFGRTLDPEDVAEMVVFAVSRPPHVVVSQLMVVPIDQG
ncbi:MAG: SDR family oxidoreductase [Ectothiorhodospiraceae bacterium]|nr:SDR family oxidoreductase [Chromatiales bacterium]MCP5153855.1 SDR family oxidoreductase [Ectothiorhodospiraceae bacterium]